MQLCPVFEEYKTYTTSVLNLDYKKKRMCIRAVSARPYSSTKSKGIDSKVHMQQPNMHYSTSWLDVHQHDNL